MKFQGYWVTATADAAGVVVVPEEFDEVELTPASNWAEAYQNEDPSMPHGFIDPAGVISDVARRWLAAHPEIEVGLASGAMEVRTVEDFGLLCLRLADGLRRPEAGKSPPQIPSARPGDDDDDIPLR
jgi:hypothetical protein